MCILNHSATRPVCLSRRPVAFFPHSPVLDVICPSGSVLQQVLLVVGLGLLVSSAAAQPDRLRHRFEAANEAYAEGRYEQAVEAYRAVLDAGYASGALYHNLGNAYARLDRVGPAVWAYERARRLRPADPRLRHNLEHVRREAGLSVQGVPARGLAAVVAGWSPLFLFLMGLLGLSAGGVGGVFGEAWRRHLGGPSWVPWGLVGTGLLLVVVALGASYVQAHDQRAVVVTGDASLRGAPNATAPPDTTLSEGAMVEIRARRTEWIQVRLGNRTEGWVSAQALEEV